MNLLRDMALFVEVVNTRSFTRAAAHLEMPASTLSRRISGLERSIGLQLLHRTTRRVEVSEAGAAYYARCAHLVAQARVAHEQLGHSLQVAQGTLRLGCTHDFATLHLAPALAEFTRRHPRVQVELVLSALPADLLAEGLDAALRIGPLKDSALVARRVSTLQLGHYASPAYLAIAPPLKVPQDLQRHVCIRMRSDPLGSTWRLHSDGRVAGAGAQAEDKGPGPAGSAPEPGLKAVAVDGRFVVSSVVMIRQLALLGAGIGVIDQAIAAGDVQAGLLCAVLPGWHLAPVPLHLLTPSRLMPARVRLFGDLLAEWFDGPAQRAQAAATRQTTSPTSSATSRERPSGPTATPTGRP